MSDRILKPSCVCGHDHLTARGEEVDRCLECCCDSWTPRCQNCGDWAPFVHLDGYDVCSRRCLLQLQWAEQRKAAA